MLRRIKGVLNTKKHAFRQHVVNNQKSYAAAVSQNSLTQPKTPQKFTLTAKQLTKFVANVVIQIAQPQVCYPNPNQDMLDLKSSKCRKISNAAKMILSVDITGKDLFESIGSRNYFRLPTHFQKTLRGHPRLLQYQVPPFKANSQQKVGT